MSSKRSNGLSPEEFGALVMLAEVLEQATRQGRSLAHLLDRVEAPS